MELDDLTIKHITYLFTQRIFKPPSNTQNKWTLRLDGVSIPWSKVWGIKSFYATPRDQVTWLKLMHRNLYLAPHKEDPTLLARSAAMPALRPTPDENQLRYTLQDPKPWPKPWPCFWPWWVPWWDLALAQGSTKPWWCLGPRLGGALVTKSLLKNWNLE